MKIPTPVKTPMGDYRIQLRLNGKSVTIRRDTAAECKREAVAVKSAHMTGRDVQKRCDMTVSQAIDAYIANRPKLSPSTIAGYRSIQRLMFPSAMKQTIDKVNWQREIDADDSHSPKTIKNAWGFIASVICEAGYPAPKVRLPDIVAKERPFLQPSQIKPFLAAIRGKDCELPALLGLHSLRRSEILDLTYNDIDLERNIIHVRGAAVVGEKNKLVHKKTNKNASSTRDISILIPRLSELVKERNDNGEEYIFTGYPNTIYVAINRVCERNNLPKVGVHGLRHSFISLCYHLGISELACMQMAGYSDYNTMRKIYTHLATEDAEQAENSLIRFFGE